jgi:two-component system response regulator (stage 0 sporulation protein F)
MVYLIDDDKSVRRGFESFLESNAMDFRSSESLEEFLSLYKPNENDLIVLDLNLPGMKGTDLFVKLNEAGLCIPVIVVTAFDEVQSREICRKYGIKEFLRKPVDAEALIDLIKYNTQP